MLIQFSKIFYKNLQDVNQLVQQDTISNAAGKFQQQQQQQQQTNNNNNNKKKLIYEQTSNP